MSCPSLRVMFLLSVSLVSCVSRGTEPSGEAASPPEGPEEAVLLHQRAKTAFEVGKFEDSLRHYRLLVGKYAFETGKKFYYPAGAESHVAIGDCLFALRRYGPAIEAYTLAMTMYPAGSRRYAQRVAARIQEAKNELSKEHNP